MDEGQQLEAVGRTVNKHYLDNYTQIVIFQSAFIFINLDDE